MSLIRFSFIYIILFATLVCNPENLYSQLQPGDSIFNLLARIDTSDYLPVYFRGALDYNLMMASAKGNDSEIRRLIEKGADVNAETDQWATPLIFAVSNNKLSAVKTLLDYNPNLNRITINGETPLLIAVKNNNFEITEVLVRAGAEINFQNRYGATPLHYSVINGNFELVDLLLYYKASIDIKSYDGTTPLLAAVWAGYTDIADHLIQNGANMEARDNDGFTPFLMAAYYGDTLLLNILFKDSVDIYATNKYNQNALALSIAANHIETIELLLKMGTDWINPSINAIDPYNIASRYRRFDAINMLKKNNIHGKINYKIDQISLSVSMRVLGNDFYSGASLAFKEPYLNAGLSFGIDTKLWYTKVLIKSSENVFYQYMDKSSVAYAGFFKDFALTDRLNGLNYSISTSVSGGYTFGNQLKGTHINTGNKFLVIPSVNLKISRLNSSVNLGIEYTKTEYYHTGPVWVRLGYSYNYFFDNSRIRIKPIRWN